MTAEGEGRRSEDGVWDVARCEVSFEDGFTALFDVSREAPVLVEHQSEGSGGSHRQDKRIDLWLWPLPEGDALSLVLQWPDLDLPLTVTRVELEPVRAALARVVPYWP